MAEDSKLIENLERSRTRILEIQELRNKCTYEIKKLEAEFKTLTDEYREQTLYFLYCSILYNK